ncbi:hypothetical protein D8S78_07895 [Natrialba swarupiae]|nr:hypothetical protein [Natrialba swarupiae]
MTPTSTIVDQLSQAGFAAELNSQDQGVWQENLSSGNFSVAAYGHTEGGNASMNHPYFSFTWKLENRDHGSANFFSFPKTRRLRFPTGMVAKSASIRVKNCPRSQTPTTTRSYTRVSDGSPGCSTRISQCCSSTRSSSSRS